MLNNLHVAEKAFIYNMGFGSGLGSYKIMFDKFSLGGWGGNNLSLNRLDGNSMFIRLSTELGVFGIIGLVYYLVHFRIKGRSNLCVYSLSILTLLLLFLLRMGNYTHAGSVLFVCLYKKIYYSRKWEIQNGINNKKDADY